MQQLLIAMKRAVETGQTNTAEQRTQLLADIAALEAALTASIAETDADLASLDATLSARIAALEAEIAEAADKDQIWEQSVTIEYPIAQDYPLTIKARVPRTITNVVTKLAAGTASVTVKINSTGLGAGAAISATTGELDTAYGSNNFVAQGDDINVTVASPSSANRLIITLYGTYIQDTT